MLHEGTYWTGFETVALVQIYIQITAILAPVKQETLLYSCVFPLGQRLTENCLTQRCFLLLEHQAAAARNETSCQFLIRALYIKHLFSVLSRRLLKPFTQEEKGKAQTSEMLSGRTRH